MRQEQLARKIALEPWEVGGELLDILSRGLYSDAKDAIREYVQNGVDAGATTVIVNVSGPRATIRDDGAGMDWGTLRKARRFGVSDKSPIRHVGFRGIGMYAAFGMCEVLHITTRQAGMDDLLHLRLQFGEMRRILESDRAAESRIGVGLANLLYEYSVFSRESYPEDRRDDHFTLVRLEGIGQEYRGQLNDPGSVNQYLLNTLPVAFPDQEYGGTVNGWLREHVRLNPIRLLLRIGKESEFEVSPPVAEGAGGPEHDWIKDDQGRRVAFVWWALSARGERIPADGYDEASGVSGYLLKLKGFTLGDRVRLKHLWPAVGGRTLYHHYTGEVHVLEAAGVYPNAARDDFEPSHRTQSLQKAFRECFRVLNRRADLARNILKTRRNVDGLRKTADGLRVRNGRDDENPFELYRDSKNLLDTLEATDRELQRLSRARTLPKPTPSQQEQLAQLKAELSAAKKVVNAAVERSGRRTKDVQQASRQSANDAPPQVALLARAVKALESSLREAPDIESKRAYGQLVTAVKIRSVARAVGVLDDLKASRSVLSETVEASRRELRTHLGWSPLGAVSLEEALAEAGFLAATSRERALIRAVDRGLLNGSGGRGERYEAILRAISEAVSDDDELS